MASLPSGILTEEEARRHPAYAEGYARYKGLTPATYGYGGNPYTEYVSSLLWSKGACAALDEDRGHESNAWKGEHFGPPILSFPKQLQLDLFDQEFP